MAASRVIQPSGPRVEDPCCTTFFDWFFCSRKGFCFLRGTGWVFKCESCWFSSL